MCFSMKMPDMPGIPATPKRDENATLVQQARQRAAYAKGVQSNIFTSAFGDANFGKSVQTATVLGAAA